MRTDGKGGITVQEDHPEDTGADTGRFKAFADADDVPGTSATRFRILTLLGALAAFALIVWLLLR